MTVDSWRLADGPAGAEQGIHGNFLEKRPLRRNSRLENIGEFSGLRDDRPQIPCAAEQGIRVTQQGIYLAEQGMNSRPAGN
jgi:hypothetical protein